MKILRWIAKKIAPDVFRDQERYRWLIGKMRYEVDWFDHRSEARAVITRYIVADYNHWRALNQPPVEDLHSDIASFRDKLNRDMEREILHDPQHAKGY